MKTKYSRKCTLNAIPEILNLLTHDLVFMARDKALQGELADLRGVINEYGYAHEDVELLSSLENPLVKLSVEAVESIWEIRSDFLVLNGFDETELLYNPMAERLATDMTDSFLVIVDSKTTDDKPMLRRYDDFPLYFETAPHVLYETAILLMTGETSMGDAKYASVAWNRNDEIVFELDRSDLNVNLLATAIEMLLIFRDRYYNLDGV